MSLRFNAKASQENIKDRESIYQSLYDNIPVGIFRTDQSGNILSANPSLVKMLGFPTEKELCSVSVFEIYLIPEDGRKIREILNKEGLVSNFETQLKRKDGSVFWCSLNVRAVSNEKLDVLFLEGVVEDITVRKNAETALRESEEQYRSMIDAMGEAMHVIDADFRIILLNPSFEKWLNTLGLDSNISGKKIFEVFPFLSEKVRSEYEQVFLTGQALITEETSILKGEEIITQTRKIPIIEEGRVKRVLTVIEDVTRNRKAVEALRESNEKYQSLVERANEGIAIIRDAKIKYVNPRLVQMLGYEDENDMLEKDVADFIHPDKRKEVMQRYQERIQGALVTSLYESILLRKEGEGVEVELNSETITYQGTLAVMVLIRDITERKTAEENINRSQERYRAISELTSDFAYSLAVSPDGEVTLEWITEAFKRLTGFSPDDISIPDGLKNVIHPEDYDVFIQSLKTPVSGKTDISEYRVIDTKGNYHYLLDKAKPVFDEKGKIVRIYGAAQDITDRKLAEQALRFRADFENLIANISTSFVNLPIDSMDDGINKALKTIGELAKVDRSYVFRLHSNSTMLSNTHEWCAGGIKPQIKNLKNLPLDSFPWFSSKLRIGETIYCPRVSELPDEALAEKTEWEKEEIKSLVNVPMLLEGRVVGFIGFDSVKTEKEWPEEILSLLRIVGESFASAFERKRAEEEIRDREVRYRALFENAGDAITLVKDEKVIDCNTKTLELFGCSRNQIVKLDPCIFSQKFQPDGSNSSELWKKKVESAMKGSSERFYWQYLRMDGTSFDAEVILNRVDIGEGAILQTIIRDITEQKLAERALRESEELYRSLIETSPDAITLTDLSGSFVMLNRQAAELYGAKDESELVGRDVFDFFIPEEVESARLDILSILQKGALKNVERTLTRSDGVTFPVELSSSLVFDGQGNPKGLINVIRDTRERKKVEQALKASEALNSAVISSSPLGISIRDSKGRLTSYNKAWRKIWGMTEEDLLSDLGRVRSELVLDSKDSYLGEWKDDVIRIYEEGGTLFIPELRFKNGSLWVSQYFYALSDSNGKVERVVILTEDITERKRIENALQESEEKYRRLVDKSLVGIYIIQDNFLRFCNQKFAEIFGYKTTEEITNKHIREIVTLESWKIIQEQIDLRISGKKETVRYEFQGVRKGGVVFDVEVLGSRIVFQGRPAIQGSMIDITERKRSEKALRESEERYRSLTEEALVGVYIYSNSERKYLFVNSEMSKITGYSQKELLDLDPNKLSVEEDSYILKEREDAVKKGESINPEYSIRIRRKDGSVAVLSVRTHRIEYAGEDVALGNCIDITELVRQRHEIEHAKQEWERTFDSIDDQVLILDVERRILKANRAAVAFTRVPLQQLTGKSCSEVFSLGRACLTKNCPHYRCINSKSTIRYEYRDPRTGRAFSVSSSPVIGNSGNVVAVVEVARDITEIREMEDALASSEAKFRDMAESVRDVIFSVSFDGTISYISPAAREILGEEPEIYTGRNILSSTSKVFDRQTRRLIQKTIKTQEQGERIPSFEIEAQDVKGRRHTLEVVARRLQNQIVGVARDITDRKKMELQLLRASKLASIGVLAAGIAHQVNNPLAIMLSASTVLRDMYERTPNFTVESKAKAIKYFGMLENQVERTRKVVSGLLAFAQDKKFQITKTNVNPLVKESLQLVVQNTGGTKVALELSLSEDLPPVFVDQVALQQVVVNIAQNAIEAMDGKGTLSVSTQFVDKKNIQIAFRDTGPGVKEESREEIFEPLFTTKATSKGTGLGLPLSVMLLERFGARIFLEENTKNGATFVVEIPAEIEGE